MNWHRWLATFLVMLALAAWRKGARSPTLPTPRSIRTTGAMMVAAAEVEAAVACNGQRQSDLV
jgi:hypothetical protein